MNRRNFFKRLIGCCIAAISGFPPADRLAGSTGGVNTLRAKLAGIHNASARTIAGPVKWPAGGGTLQGYLARPGNKGLYPSVLLIHASHGLDDPVQDAARHYSREGYVALAVDHLSRLGGTASFASPEAAEESIQALTSAEVIADLDAAAAFLRSHPSVDENSISIRGYGWGERLAILYLETNPRMKAAVVPITGHP
jgi:carboxymethylenebutenolidase